MLDAGAELGFSEETGNCGAILAKLFAKNFQRNDAVLGMVSTIDRGGSSLPDHILYAVPSESGTDKRIARHAANLIR
jgi:hypothetical protein